MNNGNKLYCLMAAGPGLTDQIRNILFNTAQDMFKKERMKHTIKGEDCEGIVTTEGEHAAMGCIAGIVFCAEFETEIGKIKVRYIVRPSDLRAENCVWSPPMTLEEINDVLEPALN